MINHAGERGGSKTSSPKLSLQGISPSNASFITFLDEGSQMFRRKHWSGMKTPQHLFEVK